MKSSIVLILLLFVSVSGISQTGSFYTGKNIKTERPIPYPITPPSQFEKAIKNGTRTLIGLPGKKYWTNFAQYRIKATVSPATKTISGIEKVNYINNSPDTLTRVVLQLRQNAYKSDAIRNFSLNVTKGMEITSVEVDGKPLVELNRKSGTGYFIDGAIMYINLEKNINSKASAMIMISWKYEIPTGEDGRQGHDDAVFFAGYWYPQISVYDDLKGWDLEPYLGGNGEFYMDNADYDVEITIPEDYLIGSTGMLENPKSVLCDSVLIRLEEASKSQKVVHIVKENERSFGKSTRNSDDGVLMWNFKAKNVRDFAFTFSRKFVWDAVTASNGKSNVMIHSFYRPEAKKWINSAEYGKFSIDKLSEKLTPYPWPQMTCVEGVISGGMEFPMITLIGGIRSDYFLFVVIYHEIGHMWFPMIVGSDEKKYSWMDEGLTTFNESEGIDLFKPDTMIWKLIQKSSYYRVAGSGNEVEPMRHADQFPIVASSFVVDSYDKPGVILHAIRGMVGNDNFYKAYKEYISRWSFKHPEPYDFFNTFKDVLKVDLDWFFRSTLFETWTLDQSVESVVESKETTSIFIKDLGWIPAPVFLTVTYQNDETEKFIIPVDVWLEGKVSTSLVINKTNVKKVEIDPDLFLFDINRKNNVWNITKN